MAEKKATVPFSGTKEQEEALMKVIHELKDEKGALMPILQKAQDIYGYLPIEVQKMISDETGIPMEKIYGVATFYSQFSLSPMQKLPAVFLLTECFNTFFILLSGTVISFIIKHIFNNLSRFFHFLRIVINGI